MLPRDIVDWLEENSSPGYRQYFAENEAETRTLLKAAGLAANSEIGEFHLRHGSASVRGWYDLIEIPEVPEMTEYAHNELGVPTRFIALTSAEGQGVVLYDTSSHAVFDVEFGQFEDLASGTLAPIAATFSEFLRWCMSKDRGA